MSALIRLSGDAFFWFGIGLFCLSVMGIVLILKSLQKNSDENSTFGSPTESFKEGDAVVGLETIAERLDNMEKILLKISQQLDAPSGVEKNELSAELRSLLQALKTNPIATESNQTNQINQLSSKVDKIYQVLISLSASEEK